MLSRFQPQLLSVLRVIAGFVFSLHGWQKVFGAFGGLSPNLPPGTLNMLMAAGWIETIGGALLMVGLFTSPVAFVASGEMAVAYFVGHVSRAGKILPMQNGGDSAVLLSFIFLYLCAAGGGAWSVDKIMGRDKKET
ncbi:MAG: DoxX family protein [Bryobacteraceae bacterium]